MRRIHDTAFALAEEILAVLTAAVAVPGETGGNLKTEIYFMIREAVSRHEERARLERRRLRPTATDE